MEKNQPQKLAKLMIRPIVSKHYSNINIYFLVYDIQVFPNKINRLDLAIRQHRINNRRKNNWI